MSTTFSDHWYRVEHLHPRLRSHVELDRHCYRGEIWHVLKDTLGTRQHRLNEQGWRIVARMDGRLSMQQIWELAVAEGGDDAPTQPETIALLAQLHEAELIQSESAPDVGALFENAGRRRQQQRRQRLNPLALRVSLFDPSRLVDLLAPAGGTAVQALGARRVAGAGRAGAGDAGAARRRTRRRGAACTWARRGCC